MLNNFFFGTIQEQFSKCTIAALSRSQHPIQKEISQGIQSHMEVWDPGVELIKAGSTESTLSVSAITGTSLWCHTAIWHLSHSQMTLPLGRQGGPRPRTALQLSTSAGSVGHCTAVVNTSVNTCAMTQSGCSLQLHSELVKATELLWGQEV